MKYPIKIAHILSGCWRRSSTIHISNDKRMETREKNVRNILCTFLFLGQLLNLAWTNDLCGQIP